MRIGLGFDKSAIFGRYVLKRPVGHGTGSIVWEAYDMQDRRSVALKEIRRKDPRFRALVGRIEEEFSINQVLHQQDGTGKKHILRIHGLLVSTPAWAFWRPKGKVLIMDLLNGLDIRRHSREKRMSLYNVLVLYYTIARALQHMHACGFVHCDLNPKNIVLHFRNPYLIDFGLSKRIGLETHAGKLGQNRYMAPEQYLGGILSAKTDACALARLVYEQLGGRLLDQVKKEKDAAGHTVARRVVNPPPGSTRLVLEPRLRGLNLEVDPEIDELLYKSMLPNPDDRPDLEFVVASVLARLQKMTPR